MLNILRKRAQSIVIQVIVLVIAIVFIFWGVGTNLGNKRNSMANVNGEEITIGEYQRAYDNTVDNYRAQFGGNIPQGFLEALGLKRQVLNQLIQTAVFRQSGREMGVTVSKPETQEEIEKMDVFQTDGRFDLDLYKQVLSQNRMNPTSFETGLRNDLLTQKVSDAVQDFAMVPDTEIQSRFALDNEEIKLGYYAIESGGFVDQVEVQEDELKKWYEENKDKYMSEEQIRLRYLFFGFDEDMASLEVSDDALRERYENNREKYVIPEQRRARHILLEVKETDPAETRAGKNKKAEEVLQLAREGRDFAELAREYSEGPTGPKGGDLGFFGRGAMVPPFDEAVFQLKPGEISNVVETRFGYHIIKLEEIREGKTRSFEEVKEEIADQIRNQEAKGHTFKRASRAYEDIIRAGSLDKYSEQNAGAVQITDYFPKSNPPEPSLADPKFMQTAFSLKKGELSSLVETGTGYAILFLDDVRKPEAPELSAVRDRVVEDFTMVQSAELARKNAEAILQKARETGNLTQAIPDDAELEETGYVRSSERGAGQELPAQVIQQGFELSLKEPFPKEPFAQDDRYLVYALLEKRMSDKTLDEEQRQQLEKKLLADARNTLMMAWLTSMKERADIWVNEPLLR